MFFRKKKYGEVEGYERISRRIEDRQADGSGEDLTDDELFADDTVLLTRESASPRGAPASPRAELPGHEMVATDEQPIQETVTLVRPPERPTAPPPRSAPNGESHAASVTPSLGSALTPVIDSPRMAMPDLSMGTAAGASLVAKDAVWEGKLVCSGNVRVEGRLRGEIQTTGALFVAADAHVEGSVRARTVTLAGEIQGDVRCDDRLEILPGGAAHGEVDTGALVVHEGAFIESRFQMRRGDGAATSR